MKTLLGLLEGWEHKLNQYSIAAARFPASRSWRYRRILEPHDILRSPHTIECPSDASVASMALSGRYILHTARCRSWWCWPRPKWSREDLLLPQLTPLPRQRAGPSTSLQLPVMAHCNHLMACLEERPCTKDRRSQAPRCLYCCYAASFPHPYGTLPTVKSEVDPCRVPWAQEELRPGAGFKNERTILEGHLPRADITKRAASRLCYSCYR